MMEKHSPESPNDREEASESTPMERFRSLAEKLVKVPPEKVAEEQARYDADEDKKRRPRLIPN